MAGNDGGLKMLLVEESRATLDALCDSLVHIGIRSPLIAQTGKDALDIFVRERPDIILLDTKLPDIDGFEVARQIRAQESGGTWSAIIFLGDAPGDDDVERGIEAGGDDYLKKPVSEVVLKAKVRAMRRLVEMQRALTDISRQLNTANKELQRLAITDGLTGIANRRMFDEMLSREWRRCARMQRPLSLIMVDIDHFMQYNEKYGRKSGDACLKAVAEQVARSASRPGDLAARYDGEEFALILGETDMNGAQWVASHIREHVADLKLELPISPSHFLTVSCGVATVVPGEGKVLETLLKSAEHALHLAKTQGRDQVLAVDFGQTGQS
jgi:diguanylate cyclase (GGDEF)-like protein